jgi:hypothetical protein
MKSKEIDEIIKDYLEAPGYVFANYKELLSVVESEEKNLTEEQLRDGIMRCKFKAPDMVALQCMVFPPLHFDILDRVLGGVMAMMYKGLVWFILFSVIVLLIGFLRGDPDLESLAIILFNLLTTSFVFRIYTKRYNTIEFIYHVLHSQGKI